MKKVLLTTTAIVGLTAPAFAADPVAVSDQPYFHHSHPMTWSGAMSIKLTNMSSQDSDKAIEKALKRDWIFSHLFGNLADLRRPMFEPAHSCGAHNRKDKGQSQRQMQTNFAKLTEFEGQRVPDH